MSSRRVPTNTGIIVAFIDYLDRLFRPLRDLSGKITLIQRAAASLEKVFDLLDTRITIAAGTLAAANYTLTFVNGSLSVTSAVLVCQ